MLFGFTMNMIGQIFEDIANESNEQRYIDIYIYYILIYYSNSKVKKLKNI